MRIVLTGATGFIGRAAIPTLQALNHEVIGIRRIPSPEELSGAQAVIHLAGEPIAGGRWTTARKRRIRDSRVEGTRALVEGMQELPKDERPSTLICASAIGIYGDRGDEELSEKSEPGEDFLASVVVDWEREAHAAESFGTRVVLARLGIVLGPGGGALAKMPPVRLGSGRQWMSWVALEDVLRFFAFALSNPAIQGPYNLVSPEPATNAEFTHALARARGLPFALRSPAWALRLGLGEMADPLLASARVRPKRALDAGFAFERSSLESALRLALKRGSGS